MDTYAYMLIAAVATIYERVFPEAGFPHYVSQKEKLECSSKLPKQSLELVSSSLPDFKELFMPALRHNSSYELPSSPRHNVHNAIQDTNYQTPSSEKTRERRKEGSSPAMPLMKSRASSRDILQINKEDDAPAQCHDNLICGGARPSPSRTKAVKPSTAIISSSLSSHSSISSSASKADTPNSPLLNKQCSSPSTSKGRASPITSTTSAIGKTLARAIISRINAAASPLTTLTPSKLSKVLVDNLDKDNNSYNSSAVGHLPCGLIPQSPTSSKKSSSLSSYTSYEGAAVVELGLEGTFKRDEADISIVNDLPVLPAGISLDLFAEYTGSGYPMVMVQLPMYNEESHCVRCIEDTCQLAWPKDRLLIQVLDDSTRQDCRDLAEKAVDRMVAAGHPVVLVRRDDRIGYKAGNLVSGLRQYPDYLPKPEYCAIFDADFKPPVDFLYQTVYHMIQDPTIGFVQGRW
ncbi:hypothetical protein CEUSTIGMA_g6201.t1 [Chlamydomonas eustigma]|uniref:Glycosyltransferase 2-like domain-containing protein n=1 Tax=Chlamydomonas eustigma TaxID=1157962 RepID=A0A250X6P2_9CHLO|nr:hypothetical protein CEUSTIGMA_g6201.t1 [Chlamydomonas eustigma]|eukprot:GAX78764.1 hypothetical protein CEUSTIGMA_g6201.t1 [Chlamydomonas eustigma]